MSVTKLRGQLARGRRDAAASERAYEEVWRAALRRLVAQAARNFERNAITAAVGWHMPDRDEVLNLQRAALELDKATEPRRVKLVKTSIGGSLAEFGLSFDLANPLVAGVIERLGSHITHIADETRRHAMRSLAEAYDKGESIPDAAKRMRLDGAKFAATRARVIARTELIGAVNGGSVAAARLTGAASHKTWLATMDARTRPTHSSADGQTVPLDQAFDVGGTQLMYPGDQDGPAEEVVSCRCTITYEDR